MNESKAPFQFNLKSRSKCCFQLPINIERMFWLLQLYSKMSSKHYNCTKLYVLLNKNNGGNFFFRLKSAKRSSITLDIKWTSPPLHNVFNYMYLKKLLHSNGKERFTLKINSHCSSPFPPTLVVIYLFCEHLFPPYSKS